VWTGQNKYTGECSAYLDGCAPIWIWSLVA